MWNWLMDPSRLNTILNLLGVILGGGALGIVLTHFRGMRSLENADVSDIRKHYAEELGKMRERDEMRDKAMRDLERHWREMIKLADDRHNECVMERDQLREDIAELRRHVRGLEDQIRAQSTDRLLILEERGSKPSEVAPHALAAARRLKGNGHK